MRRTERKQEPPKAKLRRRVWRATLEWRGHILTALLLLALYALTRDFHPGRVGPLGTQLPILIYKACALMIGACIGFWLFVFFAERQPNFRSVHDRYQVFGLMAFGMLTMGIGA